MQQLAKLINNHIAAPLKYRVHSLTAKFIEDAEGYVYLLSVSQYKLERKQYGYTS